MPRITEEQAFEQYKNVWRDKFWQDEVDPKLRAELSAAALILVGPGKQSELEAMDRLSRPSQAGMFARAVTPASSPAAENELDVKKDNSKRSGPGSGKRS